MEIKDIRDTILTKIREEFGDMRIEDAYCVEEEYWNDALVQALSMVEASILSVIQDHLTGIRSKYKMEHLGDKLVFNNTGEAIQYLTDITGLRVELATVKLTDAIWSLGLKAEKDYILSHEPKLPIYKKDVYKKEKKGYGKPPIPSPIPEVGFPNKYYDAAGCEIKKPKVGEMLYAKSGSIIGICTEVGSDDIRIALSGYMAGTIAVDTVGVDKFERSLKKEYEYEENGPFKEERFAEAELEKAREKLEKAADEIDAATQKRGIFDMIRGWMGSEEEADTR